MEGQAATQVDGSHAKFARRGYAMTAVCAVRIEWALQELLWFSDISRAAPRGALKIKPSPILVWPSYFW